MALAAVIVVSTQLICAILYTNYCLQYSHNSITVHDLCYGKRGICLKRDDILSQVL